MKKLIFILFFSLVCTFTYAQDDLDLMDLDNDTIPDLAVKPKNDTSKKKLEKGTLKVKKNVFYGLKTKKTFLKNGSVTEIFNYLPNQIEKPAKYIDQIAWYNTQKRNIANTEPAKFNKKIGKILHGPYKKMQPVRIGNKQVNMVVEEGFYYIGTKHGRWEKFGKDAMDKDFVLLDKTKYVKGWLKESEKTYYDTGKNKLKEVVPIKNGKKEGKYFAFYEHGRISVRGEYQNGLKISKWTEYHNNGEKKKETKYPNTFINRTEKPYIVAQWDEQGKKLAVNVENEIKEQQEDREDISDEE